MEAVRVIETTLGTKGNSLEEDSWLEVLIPLLERVLPQGNSDFNLVYCDVQKWWLEIGIDRRANREIGFDERGLGICLGPIGDNCGFFTDSEAVFHLEEWPPIDSARFERVWSEMVSRWEQTTGKRDV
jgi:hypothetical protein